MFRSKLEAIIVVFLLLTIPPCSWLLANNINVPQSEVVNAKH
jgi:hypothetical protein